MTKTRRSGEGTGELGCLESGLPESERFRLKVENFREVFWIGVPSQKRMLYVSPAFEAVWGMHRDRIYENFLAWRDAVHPDDLAAVDGALEGQRHGQPFDLEYRIVRPDGEIRWVYARTLLMADGPDGLAYGLAEDITERKRQKHKGQVARQRDALIREVHHRIRNNLQGVAGLLRYHAAERPEIREVLEDAITQVQAVAAIHGLQGRDARSDIVLYEMVQAIVLALRELTKAKIALNAFMDCPEPVRIAEGEAVAVALVLNELILNAVKHSAGTSSGREISVGLAGDQETARVKVFNTGSLPLEFDFGAGQGIGTGLDLVRLLLPLEGARLSIKGGLEGVEITLELAPPVLVTGKPG
jgi:PAS domain S-box-containing protein